MLLLAHAFVPTHQFVQRGDDAFYYFKIAQNFPRYGFMTFDGIHATDGVQPLWAIILCALAYPLQWLGIRDPDTVARFFVAITALTHAASCIVLFHLLARTVSTAVAIAAAGALLFPLDIVWSRVWGMENSLYALMLVLTVSYYHLRFLPRPQNRGALILGCLLGLTALSRLNAGLFVACLLVHLLFCRTIPRSHRWRFAALAALATGVVVLPYFAASAASTGRWTPISGAVKRVLADQYLEKQGIERRVSVDFIKLAGTQAKNAGSYFVTSRAGDALWLLGYRAIHDGAVRWRTLLSILFAILIIPVLVSRNLGWFAILRERFARLRPFGYVLAFGLADATVSIFLFPNQTGYAMTRWWFANNEIITVVIVATLTGTFGAYLAANFLSRRRSMALALVWIAGLSLFHNQEMLRFYFRDTIEYRDWNLSYNDEPYGAARWAAQNLPADATIGSWNAGLLGHYARQRVVNLDGLVNDSTLVPYIKDKQISKYILLNRIQYISDIDFEIRKQDVRRQLQLTPVYSHYSKFMQQPFYIYRVDGRRS